MDQSTASEWARQIEIELRYAFADHGMAAVSQVLEIILDLVHDHSIDLDTLGQMTMSLGDHRVIDAEAVAAALN